MTQEDEEQEEEEEEQKDRDEEEDDEDDNDDKEDDYDEEQQEDKEDEDDDEEKQQDECEYSEIFSKGLFQMYLKLIYEKKLKIPFLISYFVYQNQFLFCYLLYSIIKHA